MPFVICVVLIVFALVLAVIGVVFSAALGAAIEHDDDEIIDPGRTITAITVALSLVAAFFAGVVL